MARIDFVPYPPTSFPFRDLLVIEQLPLEPGHCVCEIGVGSGETTARLARMCRQVTGFEISAPTVEALRYLEDRHANLELVVADVTDPATVRAHAGGFDRLVSCDTLEHVSEPAAYFRAVATLLAPGGEFLVTFPNEPVAIMHGITRFDRPEELAALATAAGLVDVRVAAARLTPVAERVAQALGWKPLALARAAVGRLRPRRSGADGQCRPQTFDETSFFRNMRLWRRLAPAVNLYWYGVLRLMSARGPGFEVDGAFRDAPFTHCQVLVTGRRASAQK